MEAPMVVRRLVRSAMAWCAAMMTVACGGSVEAPARPASPPSSVVDVPAPTVAAPSATLEGLEAPPFPELRALESASCVVADNDGYPIDPLTLRFHGKVFARLRRIQSAELRIGDHGATAHVDAKGEVLTGELD